MCLGWKVGRNVSRAEIDCRYLDRVIGECVGREGELEGVRGTGEGCGGGEFEEGLTDDAEGVSVRTCV